MRATPASALEFGTRRIAPRRQTVAGAVVALAVLVAVVLAWRPWAGAPVPAAARHAHGVPAAQRLATCTEGALLFHDVRWAVVCQALADRGEGSGNADCDLPGRHSAPLYAQLRKAEQACAAEAQTGPAA